MDRSDASACGLYITMNHDISCQIKAFRKRNGITQTNLAQSLGVSLPTIQRWESGRSMTPRSLSVSLETLELERAFEHFVTAVEGCRRENGRFSTRIQVTEKFARSLLSWTTEDWTKRFTGILEGQRVESLADASLLGGLAGLASHPLAPGTILEVVDASLIRSPFLEVRKSLPLPVPRQSLLSRLLRRDKAT